MDPSFRETHWFRVRDKQGLPAPEETSQKKDGTHWSFIRVEEGTVAV